MMAAIKGRRSLGEWMKEYKLCAWPDLPAPFQRTGYRRMVSDMSHRHVSVAQLMATSGCTKLEVRSFLQLLAERGLLEEREQAMRRTAWQALSRWLRRGVNDDTALPEKRA